MKCEEIRSRMTLFLDDELEQNECAGIENHLDNCEACRTVFQGEQEFLGMIRSVRPLHVASPELRARVENLVSDPSGPPVAPSELRQRIQQRFGQLNSTSSGSQTRRLKSTLLARSFWPFGSSSSLPNLSGVAAMVLIVVVALSIIFWRLNRQNRDVPIADGASEFASMAADTHQRHINGQLPLEIVSELPEQISAWFAGKVPFILKLPNYQESSGQEKLYRLEGARLVGYRNDYAAYVAYQMRTRPISLVVTSDTVAQARGGEEIVAKGITFHYNSIHGLKVITWSDRGLTYALVSDLDERGQQSCVVCHQGTKDRDFIESLRPK